MQGTKGESRQFKSNVVDKGELLDWFKMDLNIWSVPADLARSASAC